MPDPLLAALVLTVVTATATPTLTATSAVSSTIAVPTSTAPADRLFAVATSTLADFPLEAEPAPPPKSGMYSVWVTGRRRTKPRVVGSAQAIDQEALERFEYTDVHRVLGAVPGVYVRNEDGFGLRPNIGLRGATSDRSAKVTLMEDGIPLSPAPYSANAAYYFPLMLRIHQVEVFKGPASIRFGPNTIGGAINLVTTPVPAQGWEGDLKLSGGQYRFGELLARVGYGRAGSGFVLEGAHVETTGFKDLDGGGDTGFARTDLFAKGRLRLYANDRVEHAVEAKLGLGDEVSNETYLGLSEEDFAKTPLRRYAASQSDRMEWTRLSGAVTYHFDSELFDLRVTAYKNDLHRVWRKVNRFGAGAPPLDDMLRAPNASNALYRQILSGQRDSDPSLPGSVILIGTNDRRFASQGALALAQLGPFRTFGVFQRIEIGARVHYDRVDRYQFEDPELMLSGRLVPSGAPRTVDSDEVGSTLALSLHAADEIRFHELTVVPGLRVEAYRAKMRGVRTQNAGERTDVEFLPGAGAHYQLSDSLGLLAGVHLGFSPVAPGQSAGVRPEKSVNYEAGFRFVDDDWGSKLELIGFASDYSNLVGNCGQSTGCEDVDLNQQFSAGRALVYGVEGSLGQTLAGPLGISFFGDLAYTFTGSRFLTDLTGSTFPLFANAQEGDPLPYVPEHQAQLTLGATQRHFEVSAALRFVDKMRDRYGNDPALETDFTPAYWVLDAVAAYVFGSSRIYAKVDNVLNNTYLSSRRPFGARPGSPLFFLIGFRHHFGKAR